MAKHLLKFNNEAEYNAATINKPAVSWCVEENTVKYDPYVPTPPTPSHDYVEIGGIKWATMNIGAETETDTGLYFQWGDVSGYTASQVGSGEGKKAFTWADYKYCNGTESVMTKYNSTDGKTVLEASDDAVIANWGGDWRMPTIAEFQALSAAVTTEWVTNYQGSGVNGRLMTDKTDSSKVLFFPAAGYCDNGSVLSVGLSGYYRSSSLHDNIINGYYLGFDHSGVYWQSGSRRYRGLPVRGVLDSAS